tara:strand:+ start:130 stop:1374 length:1245 start_codon:yes stop_codon:yes gene_type:complete
MYIKKIINYFLLILLIFFIFEITLSYSFYHMGIEKKDTRSTIQRLTIYLFDTLNPPPLITDEYIEKNIKKIISEDDNIFITKNNKTIGYKYQPLLDYSNVHGLLRIVKEPGETNLKKGEIISEDQYSDYQDQYKSDTFSADVRGFDNDYFGFRNVFDYSNLNKDNFIIIMTGGSECAGYSHIKPITYFLERKLNEYYETNLIKVLNFCMNGYTMPYEIQSFVHLGWKLNPKIVISHTGWNDAYNYNLIPKTFSNLDLIYTFFQESWMHILYDIENDNNNIKIKNPDSEKFMSSMISLIDKYKKIVNISGSEFIFGIQPWDKTRGENSLSKNLSEDQISVIIHDEMVEKNYTLFSNLEKISELELNIINFTKNNNSYEFVDKIHTNSDSAELIANKYYFNILENYDTLISENLVN